jgi:hypothetical protein
MMEEDRTGLDDVTAAPDRPPRETAGISIGVVLLLLAVPVTAWGCLQEPHRWGFWIFVPPLVASLAAIGPVFLLNEPGCLGLLAYAFVFPIAGVAAYLLYLLPVFGGWMLTGMSFGVGKDLDVWYLGAFWVGLTLMMWLLLLSRPLGTQALEFVLPGIATPEGRPFQSYLTMMMPWLVPFAWLLTSSWWRRHRKWVLMVCGATLAGSLAITIVTASLGDVWDPSHPLRTALSTIGYHALLSFLYLILLFVGVFLFGFIAKFALVGFEEADKAPVKVRPALMGLALQVVVAVVTGTTEDLAWEILWIPVIFCILLITVFPVIAAVRVAATSPHKIAATLTCFALALYPVAYYPFYEDAREASRLYQWKAQADDLIAQDRAEEAATLLAEAFGSAVRRGLPDEAAEIAWRWVPILLDQGDLERAASVSEAAIAGLGEVPFGWYLPPCIGDACSGEDPVPRERLLVLELSILRMSALLRLGRNAEAATVGLRARQQAAQAGYWHHLRAISTLLASVYRSEGRTFDAYHSLGDAFCRITRASGPAEALKRLQEALAQLRQEAGDEAFQAAAAECARRDPESCGCLVP